MKVDELVPASDLGLVAIKHGDMNALNVIVEGSNLSG